MQSKLGSTRALACSDRRLAGRKPNVKRSLDSDLFDNTSLVAEGADHRTRLRRCRGCVVAKARGRVCSPSKLNRHCGDKSAWTAAQPDQAFTGDG